MRNAKHLAHEVNTGKKDVSFLPRDFDTSLLDDNKREAHEKNVKDATGEAPAAPKKASPKTTQTTKRGGAAQVDPTV